LHRLPNLAHAQRPLVEFVRHDAASAKAAASAALTTTGECVVSVEDCRRFGMFIRLN
jgi:hypothetical protein